MNSAAERFRHVYAERDILNEPMSQAILAQLPDASLIVIERYHDVFSRPRQEFSAQASCRSLILARKHGSLLYQGAPVCHSFGHSHFYYTSPALNCVYDCEYCWLKGMYSTANVVIFINDPGEYLEEAQRCVNEFHDEPLFLSFSYETDLFPLEYLTGFLKQLSDLLGDYPKITAEIRTKCGSVPLIQSLTPQDNLVLAFTISPKEVIRRYERFTSPLLQRLAAADAAMKQGFPVRLCFDPMILFPGWKDAYKELIDTCAHTIDLSRVHDFSIGSYRQSEQYQKRMRSRFPQSAVIQYPYDAEDGYCVYPKELRAELESKMREMLGNYADPGRIYLLEDNL